MGTYEDATDEEVVEVVRTRDQECFSEIIARYQHLLMRYAIRLTGDERLAVDIVQDAFIHAFINLNDFDAGRKFSSWMYRITHNVAIDVLRKRVREVPLLDDIEYESDEDIFIDFEQKETAECLQRILTRVPLMYSEPIVLYYSEGKTYEEVSDILRIPIGTVGTRIHRGRKLIKHIWNTTHMM